MVSNVRFDDRTDRFCPRRNLSVFWPTFGGILNAIRINRVVELVERIPGTLLRGSFSVLVCIRVAATASLGPSFSCSG